MADTPAIRARKATIARAVAHLRTAAPDTLAEQLATTTLHDRHDPDRLADRLASDSDGFTFARWRAAKHVLAAAGLPTD